MFGVDTWKKGEFSLHGTQPKVEEQVFLYQKVDIETEVLEDLSNLYVSRIFLKVAQFKLRWQVHLTMGHPCKGWIGDRLGLREGREELG